MPVLKVPSCRSVGPQIIVSLGFLWWSRGIFQSRKGDRYEILIFSLKLQVLIASSTQHYSPARCNWSLTTHMHARCKGILEDRDLILCARSPTNLAKWYFFHEYILSSAGYTHAEKCVWARGRTPLPSLQTWNIKVFVKLAIRVRVVS